MADEPFALSTIPPALPAEGDYDSIYVTVMETVRGRWFLEEYAKRNRNADTSTVLNAIERIEGVIRGDRAQQAHQSFRLELLEMAKAITDTRAEIAAPAAAPLGMGGGETPGARPEVFAAAERLQDVAWTMRDRGLDAATCEQIEALANSVLSNTALRDGNDDRSRRLGEVLGYLERRINTMLDSCGEGADAGTGPAREPAAEVFLADVPLEQAYAGPAEGELAPAAPAGMTEGEVEPTFAAAVSAGEVPSESGAIAASLQPETTAEPTLVSHAAEEAAPVSKPEPGDIRVEATTPAGYTPPVALEELLSVDAPLTHAPVSAVSVPEASLAQETEFDLDVSALPPDPVLLDEAGDAISPAAAQAADARADLPGLDVAPLEVIAVVPQEAPAAEALTQTGGAPIEAPCAPEMEHPLPAASDRRDDDISAVLVFDEAMILLAPERSDPAIGDQPAEADPGPLDIDPMVVFLPEREPATAAEPFSARAELELDPIIVTPIAGLEPATREDDTALPLAAAPVAFEAPVEAPVDDDAAASTASADQQAPEEAAVVAPSPTPADCPAPIDELILLLTADANAAVPEPAKLPPEADIATGIADQVDLDFVRPVPELPVELKAPEPPVPPAQAAAAPAAPFAPARVVAAPAEEAPVAIAPRVDGDTIIPAPTEPTAAIPVEDPAAASVCATVPADAQPIPEPPAFEQPPAAVITAPPMSEPESPHEGEMLSGAWELAITREPEAAVAPAAGRDVSTASVPAPEPEIAAAAIVVVPAPEEPAPMPADVPLMWEAPPGSKPAEPAEPEPADFLLEPLSMPLLASALPREPHAAAPAAEPIPTLQPEAPPNVAPKAERTTLPPPTALAGLDDDLFAEVPPASEPARIADPAPIPLPPPSPWSSTAAPDQPPAISIPAPSLSPAPPIAEKIEPPSPATAAARAAASPAIASPLIVSPALAATPAPSVTPARTAAKPMPRPEPNDPLAALNAMSEEERLALFT